MPPFNNILFSLYLLIDRKKLTKTCFKDSQQSTILNSISNRKKKLPTN